MLLASLRKVLEIETLPPPPSSDDTEPREQHPSRLRFLIAPEVLPDEPADAAPARGAGWLRMLLAPEALPAEGDAPTTQRRRTNWLRFLFASEPLAEESPPPPRQRGRWLEWLFAFEKIDND